DGRGAGGAAAAVRRAARRGHAGLHPGARRRAVLQDAGRVQRAVSTRPVFLVDALPDGASTVLGGPEGHHAATVRRLRPGEALVLADGAGGVADCVVTGPAEGGLQLAVTAVRRLPPPEPRFVLVQALAKGDRGALAVDRAGGGQAVPAGLAAGGGLAGLHPRGRRADRGGGRGAGAARVGGPA